MLFSPTSPVVCVCVCVSGALMFCGCELTRTSMLGFAVFILVSSSYSAVFFFFHIQFSFDSDFNSCT